MTSIKTILTSRHKLTTLEISVLGAIGIIVSIISVASLHTTEVKDYEMLARAAVTTSKAYDAIRKAREGLGLGIDSINDPSYSGLIGPMNSPITTGPGDPEAKQTAINPNWAALIVRYLQRAGIKPGDPVAVGMTGSFPGLNAAVLAAIETFGAKPVWIVSLGSTSWGANHPSLSWLAMEKVLADSGIIHSRALAATLGGSNNAGAGLDDVGRDMLRATIAEHGIPLIDATPLSAAIDSEMAAFRRGAPDERYRLYINIGSGYASLGTMNAATILATGMNSPSRLNRLRSEPVEGVAAKFLAKGAKVLNLYDIVVLARAKSLPIAPAVTPLPATGRLFFAPRYSVWVNAVLLIVYVAIVLAFATGYTNFLTKNPRKKEML